MGQSSRSVSDAMILVQPQGSQALVAVIFPEVVPHAALKERVRRMAQSAGWQVGSLKIKDQNLETSPLYGPAVKLGRQTDASFVLTNAPQMRGGGFLLQPYVEAFRDLNRFEILYWIKQDPSFQELRAYESPALSVNLIHEGSPYRYIVEVRDHAGALPTLPLTQARPVTAQTGPDHHDAASPGPALFAPVLMLAAAAGLLMLVTMFIRLRLRAALRQNLPSGTKGISNRG
jgi:hypothetical protein